MVFFYSFPLCCLYIVRQLSCKWDNRLIDTIITVNLLSRSFLFSHSVYWLLRPLMSLTSRVTQNYIASYKPVLSWDRSLNVSMFWQNFNRDCSTIFCNLYFECGQAWCMKEDLPNVINLINAFSLKQNLCVMFVNIYAELNFFRLLLVLLIPMSMIKYSFFSVILPPPDE